MTYGGTVPTITPSLCRLREWRQCVVSYDGTDVLDHRDIVESSGPLPEQLLGSG